MTEPKKHDPDLAALFVQGYSDAWRAARNLQVSIRRTADIMPLSGELLERLDDVALERLDAFRVRYAQLQDLLAKKLFRSLLLLEEETTVSMLEVLNAMEKRRIIESFERWKMLRESSNTFMHDYPDQGQLKAEALSRTHGLAGELCEVLNRVRDYAVNRVGLAAQALPETPS